MKKTGSIPSFLTIIPLWVLIPVLLLVYNLAVGFNGLYGQDSFEYLRYSRVLHQYLSRGGLPGTCYWPVLYPLSGALLSFLLPDILSLQLVSITCYGLTLLYLEKILIYHNPGRKKEMVLYGFLFFSMSPFVLRYSSVVMSDSMTLFFLAGFLYHYLLFSEKGRYKDFIVLILFGFAAINTRYASIVIVAVPLFVALFRFMKIFHLDYFLLAILTSALVFLPEIILKLQGAYDIEGSILVPGWLVTNMLHRSFFTPDGYFNYNFPNLCFVFSSLFHPGYIFTGVLFLFLVKPKTIAKPFMLTILVVYIVYAVFLAGLATQNARFLLLTFLVVIILYAEPFLRCLGRICEAVKDHPRIAGIRMTRQKISTILVIGILLIQVALFYRAFMPFYSDSHTTREIAGRLKSYPGRTIYTVNIDMGLKAYGIPNEISNLWVQKINNFKPGSLILFNYVHSYRQWKDSNPIYNWEKANNEHELKLIEKFPSGWNLYEIKN